jgi:hypothetical protein
MMSCGHELTTRTGRYYLMVGGMRGRVAVLKLL